MTPDERFDRIDANLAELKESIGEITASLGRLTESHANLARYVLDFREETAHRLEVIDNRLDVLGSYVSNIDARYPAFTKAILDFGKVASQLTIEQAANKNAIAELAQKVSKLNPAA